MAWREEAESVLRERFGLESFRPGQGEIIERLLTGKSAVAVFPTGAGKSLCYQLPALLLPHLTVVVSPLIALMKDQMDALQRRGIDAVRLDSSLSIEAFRDGMQRIRSGTAKILYVAPERFFNERFRESLSGMKISLFAIDEAHCISQWGHNFRPDYLKLGPLARQYQAERILALTATATPQVLEDICNGLGIEHEGATRTPFHRSNLILRTSVHTESNRDAALLEHLQTKSDGPRLVYVTLQKTAERLAEELATAGLAARAYHAGMQDEAREEIQNWFMTNDQAIVVATIAFGMGIDRANIRGVYHYNLPKSLENYAQEIGRAGRDGQDAVCQLMLVPEDRTVLDNFIYGDTPTRSAIGKFVERIAGQPENFYVSQYHLSSECDIRQIVLRTLLCYLELDGYLESTAPRYDSYQFKPRLTSKAILEQLPEDKRAFAGQLLACAVPRKIWFHIDTIKAAQRLKCDRSRIVRALDFMGEKGWLELEVRDLVHGYRKLQRMSDPPSIADALYERVMQREQSELQRLDQVFAFALAKKCQADHLSQHFGESLNEPCGRCSACLKTKRVVSETKVRKLGTSVLTNLPILVDRAPQALGEARQAARFLCGISSPALVSAKLTRDGLFGCCESIPFSQVLEACESLLASPSP